MACNLSNLLRRCFYTGWVGDHQDKPYDAKYNTYIFGKASGDISDDEVLYQNENLKVVTVEPDYSTERYNSSNTKKADVTNTMKSMNESQELMELLDDDRKEEN